MKPYELEIGFAVCITLILFLLFWTMAVNKTLTYISHWIINHMQEHERKEDTTNGE